MQLRVLILFLLLLKISIFFSQETISISIHHDTKFLFIGDERGNHAGTTDILIKLEFPVKKFKKAYLTVFPSFEFADLHSGALKRYSLGAGYTQKDIFLKKLYLGVYGDYGFIKRMGYNTNSFGLHFELFYRINNRFSLSYIHQIIERSDLKNLYNETNYFKPSSFVGFKIHF
ncbi:hypothetical protein [Polaribacter sp.]|uniref:hypothetical protein n=1 Tax=Polaribacter sp. TaxID=1920175 RepID=UPI003F6B6520